ncbi:MAG: ATP phosphoribosyltransferase regulatory subunit [Planctomycetes bacterium]|nr:ATP phosphoribosyltransferase regulatory subunit [Planctomycetota bacterium]
MANAKDLTFPPGAELVFGPQAQRRGYVNEAIARVFAGWGFSEIILPTFDARNSDDPDAYTMIDREGRNLALRADFTEIAAKALAIELRRDARTIRACYEGRVYRFQPSGHGARVEQSQRGLEWVNVRGAIYDAATILIARECLDALGLDKAVTVICHAAFVNAALGEKGRADRALHEAIDHKNPARILELARRRGFDAKSAELLAQLPRLCGGPEVLQQAGALAQNTEARTALDELADIVKLLEAAGGLKRGVLIDLGEVRQFNYYSGMMFRIYNPEVGDDLGGGGRYDRLFDRYGMDVPAVGLGLDIARVTEALPRKDMNGEQKPVVVTPRDGLAAALKARALGKTVVLEGQ